MSKELADRIVALGVGSKHFGKYAHTRLSTIHDMTSPDQFVNDGRVMLALMEKVRQLQFWRETNNVCAGVTNYGYPGKAKINGNLCHAICEACCDALEANDEEGR